MRLLGVFISFLIGVLVGYSIALILARAGGYLPYISLAISSVIAVGIAIWREYFIAKPNLSVEINYIERKLSLSNGIDIYDYSDFRTLAEDFPELLPSQSSRSRNSLRLSILPYYPNVPAGPENNSSTFSDIDEFRNFFSRIKQEVEDFPPEVKRLENILNDLKEIDSDNFSEKDYKKISGQASGGHPFTRLTPIPPPINPSGNIDLFSTSEGRKKQYEKLKERLEDILERGNLRLNRLSIPNYRLYEMEEKIKRIEDELIENNSKFFISASIINSGRLNTAIKTPATLAVYITKGIREPIELVMKEPEEKSDLAANSTNVIDFESEKEVSQLEVNSRNLINKYWDKDAKVNAVLFVEDIRGKIYYSNAVPFVAGAYQRKVYERLEKASAEHEV
ncbi:MAG: hypothetical protein AAFY20_15085 [Cyanobacteria bacterium J06639_14]